MKKEQIARIIAERASYLNASNHYKTTDCFIKKGNFL